MQSGSEDPEVATVMEKCEEYVPGEVDIKVEKKYEAVGCVYCPPEPCIISAGNRNGQWVFKCLTH